MKRIALSALLLLSSLSAVVASAGTHLPADRIVAVVNSDVITQYELDTRMALVQRQLRGQNVSLPPRDVFEKQLLERMIVDLAQMQYAKESGLQVTEGELDGALRRIADSNRMSVAEFRKAIEKDSIDWPKFREDIRQEMVIARLREREVANRMSISESEIDTYLEREKQASQQEVVRVAHILVRVPEQASADQLERQRARAEQAAAQLASGAKFARVAAAFSDAPDGLSGGVMDARPLNRLPTLYAEVVKTMTVGETSRVLKSPAGYHIVRLLERQGGASEAKPLKQTHARHILIKVNELLSDSDAQQRARVLKERLDNGGDFAELAKSHSGDLSATKGGDLGWLYEGDTVPEFERAMEALKVNAVSEPIRSPFGWHIIQVLERRTEDASKERQRLQARQALRERKGDEAYQDWLRQLRDRCYVEYRLEEK